MKRIKFGGMMAVVACALAACLGLVGCSQGPTAEEVITQGISDTLDQVKTLDDETLDEIVSDGEAELDELKGMGIDGRELFKSVFDGFDYKVASVSVDGNSASASIDITAKSFNDAADKATELAEAWVANHADELATMDEDAVNLKIGELTMQAFGEIEPKSSSATVTFTKQGNEWSCDSDLLLSIIEQAFYA